MQLSERKLRLETNAQQRQMKVTKSGKVFKLYSKVEGDFFVKTVILLGALVTTLAAVGAQSDVLPPQNLESLKTQCMNSAIGYAAKDLDQKLRESPNLAATLAKADVWGLDKSNPLKLISVRYVPSIGIERYTITFVVLGMVTSEQIYVLDYIPSNCENPFAADINVAGWVTGKK